MIFDIILLFLSFLLGLFADLLSVFNFFPEEISTAIAQFFGYSGYLQGILPIVPDPTVEGLAGTIGILTVVGWSIKFLAYFYLVKILLWVFGFIPFFRHKEMPSSRK
jgi:hypothetical protein